MCKDMLRSSRSVWKRGILPGLCNCHFYLARGFNPIKTIYVRKPNSSSNKGEHKRALTPPSNLSCCEDNGGMCGKPIHPFVASPNDPNRWSMGTAFPLKIDDGKSQVTTAYLNVRESQGSCIDFWVSPGISSEVHCNTTFSQVKKLEGSYISITHQQTHRKIQRTTPGLSLGIPIYPSQNCQLQFQMS